MNEKIIERVLQSIPDVAALYNRLILVVMPSGSGKTFVLREISQRLAVPLININLELSRRLLDLTARQRLLYLERILGENVNNISGDVALLDNIEILFEDSLKRDPLKLLQDLSRNKTIVAAWSGTIDKQHLVYAVPAHSEYRRYPISGFVVINEAESV